MVILIDMDQVTVNGTIIKRPTRISRSDWLWFWDCAKAKWYD